MNPGRVFPFRLPLTQPRLRLICVPYAGGSASLYRPWRALVAHAIDVCAVELPGRGVRSGEPPVSDMTSLCDGLAAAIEPLLDGVPLAVFGHSMGARIAFELAHRFDGRVAHLFASGSPAPGDRSRYGASGDRRPTSQLSDDDFKQRLRELGGTPPEVLADAGLMARVLPVVRADFTLIERYQVAPQTRVSCPITVFAGVDDPGTSPATAAAWELRTTAACRLVELDAGHFFLDSHRAELFRELGRDLAAASVASRGRRIRAAAP
ncbi:MAG TPA: alpha/beta fold hydrolase [Kofleriaceae bacterium]|nr:alpha/beta fold hydrolase [Kofleriaceae bacterium]